MIRAARRHPDAAPATAQRKGFGFEPFAFGAAAAEELFSGLFASFRPTKRASFQARGGDRTYEQQLSFLDAALGAKRRLLLRHGHTVEVVIPAGISDGQSIRLTDQGDPEFAGAAPGDALARLSVEPNPYFSRQGTDVRLEVPVTLKEAVLGARIRVPTVAGEVSMRVPKGSNTLRVLRLQGKGIKDAATGTVGDQYNPQGRTPRKNGHQAGAPGGAVDAAGPARRAPPALTPLGTATHKPSTASARLAPF